MEINEVAAIGYGLATTAFALISVLVLGLQKGWPQARFVMLACGVTAVWAALQGLGSLGYLDTPLIALVVEWVRNIAWLTALVAILRELSGSRELETRALRFGAFLLLAGILLAAYHWMRSGDPLTLAGVIAGGIGLSALNIVLAEQIFRNAPFDDGSSLRYLAVGVLGIFAYDLVIFALVIIQSGMTANNWAARGYVTALTAMPLAVAVTRPLRLSLDTHVPRQIVFYFFGLVAIAIFLVLVLAGDYYVRTYAGDWAGVARVVLFSAAVLGLAIVLVSKTIRARVRVSLAKSFLQYKYDYRKEWLRFIDTLSRPEQDTVANTAVRSVSQIVNSPGGGAWVQEETGKQFEPIGAWGADLPAVDAVGNASSLARFLRSRQWIVDLSEMREHPGRYEGLELEPWIAENDTWWLIVPLLLGDRLLGFIMLLKPRVAPKLNFEDHDLLRTVGRHAATHIEQAESDMRLTEARQFATYNRLTAFLMHDLNNLIAQQSLVVKNAERHRRNPEFVDDAIDTIAHSVARMRRLMEQLSRSSTPAKKRTVDLAESVSEAESRVSLRKPKPIVSLPKEKILVQADRENLATIIEHLIRNAQDATAEDGQISVTGETDGTHVTLRIEDTGSGMTRDFISKRLFSPFDSTKGSASMGIGAYQAREYVRELGGQLDVQSSPGAGTTFSIRLPLA